MDDVREMRHETLTTGGAALMNEWRGLLSTGASTSLPARPRDRARRGATARPDRRPRASPPPPLSAGVPDRRAAAVRRANSPSWALGLRVGRRDGRGTSARPGPPPTRACAGWRAPDRSRRPAARPASRPRRRTTGSRRRRQLAQEHDLALPLARRHRDVAHARVLSPPARPARGSGSRTASCAPTRSCRCSATAHAIDTPS